MANVLHDAPRGIATFPIEILIDTEYIHFSIPEISSERLQEN